MQITAISIANSNNVVGFGPASPQSKTNGETFVWCEQGKALTSKLSVVWLCKSVRHCKITQCSSEPVWKSSVPNLNIIGIKGSKIFAIGVCMIVSLSLHVFTHRKLYVSFFQQGWKWVGWSKKLGKLGHLMGEVGLFCKLRKWFGCVTQVVYRSHVLWNVTLASGELVNLESGEGVSCTESSLMWNQLSTSIKLFGSMRSRDFI